MPTLDLAHFRITDPAVLAPNCNRDAIRYSDLNYSSRFDALLKATYGSGKRLECDPFNDLCNGRRSLQYVMDAVEKL